MFEILNILDILYNDSFLSSRDGLGFLTGDDPTEATKCKLFTHTF